MFGRQKCYADGVRFGGLHFFYSESKYSTLPSPSLIVQITCDFLDVTLSETTKQIEEDCVRSHSEYLKNIIEPLKPMSRKKQFWMGVWQSVLGAFFFALIVAAFAFIKSYGN